MDTSQLLRDARRHAGFSQRQLAAASGVALRTVADAESGRRRLSVSSLDTLMAACGLDLVPVPRSDADACPHLRDHLRLSTTARLHRSFGGDGADLTSGPPLWQDLRRVAHANRVLLDGAAGVGTWVPGVDLPDPVRVETWRPRAGRPPPSPGGLRVRYLPAPRLGAGWVTAVPVVLPGSGTVLVPPPADLLLDLRCREHGVALRAAGRCLHQHAGRDDAGRRAPPHRLPDEDNEAWNLLRSLTYAMDTSRLPDPTDSRAWRIAAPVSLGQWLEEHGRPRRRGDGARRARRRRGGARWNVRRRGT